MESSKPAGKIKNGWRLTKSAWHVLRLDKELSALPLFSFLASLVVMIPLGIAFFAVSIRHDAAGRVVTDTSNWAQWVVLALFYFFITLIANVFGGAIIYGATQRFRGDDPTISSSIGGAMRKIRPLAGFSLMMATVGLLLQLAEDKLPFGGRIAAYLFDAAWSIANVFAVPVIVLSDEDVGPLQATKRSAGIIRQIWGESIVVSFGVGIIAGLTYLLYTAAFIGVMVPLSALYSHQPSGWAVFPMVAAVTLGLIGFILIALVFSALASIAKAALYHYATTGEAPGAFDPGLLRASLGPKKG